MQSSLPVARRSGFRYQNPGTNCTNSELNAGLPYHLSYDFDHRSKVKGSGNGGLQSHPPPLAVPVSARLGAGPPLSLAVSGLLDPGTDGWNENFSKAGTVFAYSQARRITRLVWTRLTDHGGERLRTCSLIKLARRGVGLGESLTANGSSHVIIELECAITETKKNSFVKAISFGKPWELCVVDNLFATAVEFGYDE